MPNIMIFYTNKIREFLSETDKLLQLVVYNYIFVNVVCFLNFCC